MPASNQQQGQPKSRAWPTDIAAARKVQESLRSKVICEDAPGLVRHVAGVDVGVEEKGATIRAAVAVLSFPGLELCDQRTVLGPGTFPYVPGYLSFRELPAILQALDGLATVPDLILFTRPW